MIQHLETAIASVLLDTIWKLTEGQLEICKRFVRGSLEVAQLQDADIQIHSAYATRTPLATVPNGQKLHVQIAAVRSISHLRNSALDEVARTATQQLQYIHVSTP